MKITVIGGGSTYTPELIEGFADRSDVLGLDELVLYDIDHARLEVVGAMARRMLEKRGYPGKLVCSTDLDASVAGAAAVLIQLRVGGQAARLRDEVLPHEWGLLGQETTGIGGFFKALRTVPVVLSIAERVRELAGPDCWIIDFTNPTGIQTRALLDHGHRALGLCNVGIHFQMGLADVLEVPAQRVELDHAGLNHLTWIRRVVVDGVDRLPELLSRDDFEPFIAQRCHVPMELVRTLGAIPSYYLSYYYATDAKLREQLELGSRAEQVMAIETELLEYYADPAHDTKPEMLARRGGAHYSTAAAALATSLLTGDGARHFVNTRNAGALPGLGDEVVVEVPATVDQDGAHIVDIVPLATEARGLVQAVTAYEELTIEAAVTGDPRVAKRALVAHPLIRQWDKADPAFRSMLQANQSMLPQFDCGCGDD